MILSFLLTPYTLLIVPLLFYLLPYLRARALRDVSGPPLAAFSNLWLMYQCRRGKRYLAVDNAHKKYGPLVRIQPNHISIADPGAIPIVYSHTGGWTKRYNSPMPIHEFASFSLTVADQKKKKKNKKKKQFFFFNPARCFKHP